MVEGPSRAEGGWPERYGIDCQWPSPKSCQQMSFVLAMRVGKIKFDMFVFFL